MRARLRIRPVPAGPVHVEHARKHGAGVLRMEKRRDAKGAMQCSDGQHCKSEHGKMQAPHAKGMEMYWG